MNIDSLNISFFSRQHFWWRRWEQDRTWLAESGERRFQRRNFDAWHLPPDEHSLGGTGFTVRFIRLRFGLHMVVNWGGH